VATIMEREMAKGTTVTTAERADMAGKLCVRQAALHPLLEFPSLPGTLSCINRVLSSLYFGCIFTCTCIENHLTRLNREGRKSWNGTRTRRHALRSQVQLLQHAASLIRIKLFFNSPSQHPASAELEAS
jgi:hypothetical protein